MLWRNNLVSLDFSCFIGFLNVVTLHSYVQRQKYSSTLGNYIHYLLIWMLPETCEIKAMEVEKPSEHCSQEIWESFESSRMKRCYKGWLDSVWTSKESMFLSLLFWVINTSFVFWAAPLTLPMSIHMGWRKSKRPKQNLIREKHESWMISTYLTNDHDYVLAPLICKTDLWAEWTSKILSFMMKKKMTFLVLFLFCFLNVREWFS